MKYEISIRITFSDEITNVLYKEKERFITIYGSSYKSEPHITLYLDSYTPDGYSIVLNNLKEFRIKPFTISLLEPSIRIEKNRHRNLYVVELSNKESLCELHEIISKIANPYRSAFIREKTQNELKQRGIVTDGTRESLKKFQIAEESFDPHITLGEIDFDKPQADIVESQINLKSIKGKALTIREITVFFYGKEDAAQKAHLIEKVVIPFN